MTYENEIKNHEIYKFDNLNQNQILKLFNREPQTIFLEPNSKKHLTKIFEMIKNNFLNNKTNNYLNLYFSPNNKTENYNQKKEIIKEILKIDFPEEISTIIKNLEKLKTKIIFNQTLYTLENTTQKILYENYKLNSFLITKSEIEKLSNTSEEKFILITEEEIYAEIEIYKLKDFQKIIIGNILKQNKNQLKEFIKLNNNINLQEICKIINKLTNLNLEINLDFKKLEETLKINTDENIKLLSEKSRELNFKTENTNNKLKNIIKQKQLSLTGDELLEVINSGNMENLQKKFNKETLEIIQNEEKQILQEFKNLGINLEYIFENRSYPLKISEELFIELDEKINQKSEETEFEYYKKLGKFNFKEIKSLFNISHFIDLFYGIKNFIKKYNLEYPTLSNEIKLDLAKNIYIENATPINYGLATDNFNLNKEQITVLTGANSGGKTTLLEMFLQIEILSSIGFPAPLEKTSKITLFDEIIYLKKFTGTIGSGAFEQTIRNLIEILNKNNKKLILIDEFEAITEPGAAAKILIQFLQELSLGNNFCVAVSHLGIEIQKFLTKSNIKNIRIDGISATGLDNNGNLITKHQPTFYQLGKSTPELIIKRVLQDEKFWQEKSKKTKEILIKMSI